MSEGLVTLRFAENQFYDIIQDSEVVTFMGITNIGTWHTTIKLGKASELRSAREAFQQYTKSAIACGQMPREVNLGG